MLPILTPIPILGRFSGSIVMKGDIRDSRFLRGRLRETLDGVAAGIMSWAQRYGVVDEA